MGSPTLLVSAAVRRGAIIRMTALAVLLAVVTSLVAVLIPVAARVGGRGDGPDHLHLLVRDDHLHRHLRRRRRGHPVLGPRVPRAAGGRHRRAADPRAHGSRDRVDGDPGGARRSRSGSSAPSCSRRTGTPGPTRTRIKVVAQQFAWRFEYDDGKVKAGVLKLPLGRTTKLDTESLDVIHAFWVPQLGQKTDIVPGIVTTINVTPTQTRDLPDRLHRALRARARDDARNRRGRQPGRLRRLARRAAGRGHPAAPTERRSSRARAAAAATRSPRPDPGRRSGRTSTTSEPRAPTSSASRSSILTRRLRRGINRASCRRTTVAPSATSSSTPSSRSWVGRARRMGAR